MADTNPQLEVEDLVLVSRETGRVLLDQVSTTIRYDERVGIIGMSGAGNTLLARSLIGLLPSGVIKKEGRMSVDSCIDADIPTSHGRRLTAMVPQNPSNALPPSTAALRLIRDVEDWTSETKEQDDPSHATRLLGNMGLKPEMYRKRSHQLSGGMAMRVAIAAAMATNPRFLLLDEPSSGLDPLTRRNLAELILTINREQSTSLIIATHDYWMVDQLCDRIIVLENGRIIAEGTPDALAKEDPKSYVGRLYKPFRVGIEALFEGRPSSQSVVADQPPEDIHSPRESNPKPAEDLILEADNVTIEYVIITPRRKRVRALADVSFNLSRGESTGVIGLSGAGKSTLAMACAGFLTPAKGSIRFLDHCTRKRWPWFQKKDRAIRMVFQNPFATINPRRTIGAWLSVVLWRAGQRDNPAKGAAHSVAELLSLVGLDESVQRARPAEISGGECQRAVIAACIASRAQVLILDEPVSMLDPIAREGIINLLQKLRETMHWTYLIVSHDIATICRLCDTLMVLDNGCVVESGPLEQVVNQPKHESTKELLRAFTERLPRDRNSECDAKSPQ